METKTISNLEHYLRRWPRALLLLSGGTDSSLLLAVAAQALGSGLTVLTFTGPHIAPGELAAAWTLARRFRVKHLIREVDPLSVPDFRQNTRQRCYACKKAIIQAAWDIAVAHGAEALWDGTNVDDLGDFRPGLKAARELGVDSPLLAAGLDKAAIRRASRHLGLPWQKPPQSCLATRFPYDTLLTREALARVGQAEAWLRRKGFTHVRLRVKGEEARLELAPEQWGFFLSPEVRRPFTTLATRLGWRWVDLVVPGGGSQGP
ncbi:MAG: ATP-dependent sacrificial sulfur transferase LarE [Desulfobaccales bacterium]|nr:ATP-dependent sacrificial sulfur transferase LarE [Desulfobaccales bacterium]